MGLARIASRFEDRNRTMLEVLSGADALICPSRFLLQRFRARGIDPQKLILNTHGLDSSRWLTASEPQQTDEVFRIGYLGQIHPHKGVHLLLEAFSRLTSQTPLELMIYGDETASTDYSQRLRRLARGDARIRMMGRYRPQQVAQVLAQIGVLVIPSMWNEIGPLVMYEAFGTKTPVIASDIPNMSYVVEHQKNGLLFTCGSSADLADKLHQLVDDAELLSRLRAGIEPVKSIDEEMRQILTIYRGAASQSAVRGEEPR